MKTLGDVIERQKRQLGLSSNRKIAGRIYEKTGRTVHHTSIGNLIRGVHQDIKPATLDILAKGLATMDHPYHDLLAEMSAIASMPVGDRQAVIDLPELQLLDKSEIRWVEDGIRMLARAKRAGTAASDDDPGDGGELSSGAGPDSEEAS